MAFNHYILFMLISTILASSVNKDPLSLSNFDTVPITNLNGVFDIDFENKLVRGDLHYFFSATEEGSEIRLDTKNLNIEKKKKIVGEEESVLEINLGEEDENLGTPLIIPYEFTEGQSLEVHIRFSTKEESKAVQFLTKEQTIGKEAPFFFTLSKMVLGRQLMPSQDTPAHKFPFYLGIQVPEDYLGLISGVFDKEEDVEDGKKIYYYKQDNHVPNYLISLAAGNIEPTDISEKVTVFCEPQFTETAKKVLQNFSEYYIKTVEYLGEHPFGHFNILVMPNSFPYSAIENPYLAYCSQCLFDEEKPLIDDILSQLVHDWVGNSVTNDNWSDYWLNAGVSAFITRKIMGKINEDNEYIKAASSIGVTYIKGWSDYYENGTFSTLHPNFTNVNPEDYYSDIPIEKGFNLMYRIEQIIGEDNMDSFLQSYFSDKKFGTINSDSFYEYLTGFCTNNSIEKNIEEEEWNRWINEGGYCPVDNHLENNEYQKEIDEILAIFDDPEADLNETIVEKVKGWNSVSKVILTTTFEIREQLLTDRQHDFINKLQLYQGQDFFVYSNYYRMILSRTDQFYENELENIETFLSTYGCFDYLSGTYEVFYKRDEVESIRLFESLKDFYHPIFISNVQEEIDYQIENFPILTVELKDNDKCISWDGKKLELKVDNYVDSITYENIPKGFIYLGNDEEQIEVKCTLKNDEKYCELVNDTQLLKSGNYSFDVSKRIQKIDYAIKVHTSNATIAKHIEIDQKSKQFNIDYAKSEKYLIEINFKSEPDEIKVKYEEEDIKCKLTNDNLTLECEIDDKIFIVNKANPDEYKTYTLQLLDYCNNQKYTVDVKVKNSTADTGKKGFATWKIIVICIAGVIFIVAIVLLICRMTRKKSDNVESLKESNDNKLLSDI